MRLSLAALALLPSICGAATVNWLDTLNYQKPAPLVVNEPSESTNNKYWIDLTSGSGSTCSQASPCGSMDSVLGKTGLNGGPAIIYVKGTGSYSWFNDTVSGSGDVDCRTTACTNWILVKPWPAGTPGCAAECVATFNGDSNMNSTSVNHVIFDGGPNLKFHFVSNGASSTYVNHIITSYVIIYRTTMNCTTSGVEGWAVGDSAVASHIYFINNEFYGCASTGDQVSAVYVGPGAGGGYTDFVFQNNIVRDMGGEGIEVNPRVTSDGATITGNVFHTIGYTTCGTSWLCRPAITIAIQSGGGNNNSVITNNVMWDISSGCFWDRGGGTPASIFENNTCYDYGKGTPSGNNPNPEGVSGPGSGTVTNNLFVPTNGTAPIGAGSNTGNTNGCPSGLSCLTSKVNFTTTDFLSTSTSSRNFLKIGVSSPAKDAGTTVSAVTIDFMSKTRPVNSVYDIGAYEYGSTGSPPSVPGNPR
jgi:hypothetical protein